MPGRWRCGQRRRPGCAPVGPLPYPGGTSMCTAPQPQLEVTASRQFNSWLAEQRLSLAFTTYQAGKLFLIGLQPDGRLSIFERTFNRCLGLWSDGQTMWL